jgi:hypothetical protein
MRLGVLVATLVLLGAFAGASAAAGDPATRLRALSARYDAHLRSERPDLGSRAGLARCDDRLVPVTESSLARDAALVAEIADSAAALEREALGPGEQRALAALRERLEREAAPLRSGAWRREPSAYLALVHDAVMQAAQRPHISPCERERRALRRLRAVPEVLRSAEVNLGAASAFDPDSEAVRWGGALADLRTTLPRLFPECHDAERFADLVEADSLALGAARRFVARMRARMAR